MYGGRSIVLVGGSLYSLVIHSYIYLFSLTVCSFSTQIHFHQPTHLTVSCLPDVEGNNCYVYKGETTVLHDESAVPADIEAAVLSSIEDTISSGELTSIDTVEKTTYLGDSLDDVTDALGPLETTVDYYYTVETTPDGSPDTFASEMESGILEGVADDVSLSGIGAITSSPPDSELTECKCTCCLVFDNGGRSVVLVGGSLYSLVIHSYIYLFSLTVVRSLLKFTFINPPTSQSHAFPT